jgi:hypothetical protein
MAENRDLLIAAIRAEIERDGVPVLVTDEELIAAVVGPGLQAYKALLEGQIKFSATTSKAEAAFQAFIDAFELVEDIERLRVEIEQLPHTDLDDAR